MQISDTYSSANAVPRMPVYSEKLMPPPIPALESQWALFLDVDGTLLDLAPTPDAVKIPDGLIDLLARLNQRLGGALALISGRRVQALDILFKPLLLPCVGLHGFEWRDSEGHEYRRSLDPSSLQAMRAAAGRLADTLPAVLVEDKMYSMAFHFRKARRHQMMLRSCVEEIARSTGFIVQHGIDVYEIRPPGSDKGYALAKLMRDNSFRNRLPIYIGDDITDEKAISAAQKFAGIGIHVGPVTPSGARFGLPSPGAVMHWLYRWEEQLS